MVEEQMPEHRPGLPVNLAVNKLLNLSDAIMMMTLMP